MAEPDRSDHRWTKYCPAVNPTEERKFTLETHKVSNHSHLVPEDSTTVQKGHHVLGRYPLETCDVSLHGFEVVANKRGASCGCRTSNWERDPPPRATIALERGTLI
jgi:hypothetical protein